MREEFERLMAVIGKLDQPTQNKIMRDCLNNLCAESEREEIDTADIVIFLNAATTGHL